MIGSPFSWRRSGSISANFIMSSPANLEAVAIQVWTLAVIIAELAWPPASMISCGDGLGVVVEEDVFWVRGGKLCCVPVAVTVEYVALGAARGAEVVGSARGAEVVGAAVEARACDCEAD